MALRLFIVVSRCSAGGHDGFLQQSYVNFVPVTSGRKRCHRMSGQPRQELCLHWGGLGNSVNVLYHKPIRLDHCLQLSVQLLHGNFKSCEDIIFLLSLSTILGHMTCTFFFTNIHYYAHFYTKKLTSPCLELRKIAFGVTCQFCIWLLYSRTWFERPPLLPNKSGLSWKTCTRQVLLYMQVVQTTQHALWPPIIIIVVCVVVPVSGWDDSSDGVWRHQLPGAVAEDQTTEGLPTTAWHERDAQHCSARLVFSRNLCGIQWSNPYHFIVNNICMNICLCILLSSIIQ